MKKKSANTNFLFKTKADTLKQLAKLVKQSKIEKIYIFSIEEWENSQKSTQNHLKVLKLLCKVIYSRSQR